MSLGQIVSSLLRTGLLPEGMAHQVVRVNDSVVILNDGTPVLLRVRAGATAFIDLWIRSGSELGFAAMGSGVEGREWPGEIRALASIYPYRFQSEKIQVQPAAAPPFVDTVTDEVRGWNGRPLAALGGTGEPFTAVVYWRATFAVKAISGTINWCVPNSMATLTAGLYNPARSAEDFARHWDQAENQPFVEGDYVNCGGVIKQRYECLRDEAWRVRIRERVRWEGGVVAMSRIDIESVGRATMIAQYNHAEVISGAASVMDETGASLGVYSAATSSGFGYVVRAYHEDYLLRFAFTRY